MAASSLPLEAQKRAGGAPDIPARTGTASADRLELQQAVEEAERVFAEGNWVENSEVVRKLKR